MKLGSAKMQCTAAKCGGICATLFFSIVGPDLVLTDEDGLDLPNIEHVKSEAVRGARGMLAEDMKAGRPIDHQRFEVFDEAGSLVLVLPFRDVITFLPNPKAVDD